MNSSAIVVRPIAIPRMTYTTRLTTSDMVYATIEPVNIPIIIIARTGIASTLEPIMDSNSKMTDTIRLVTMLAIKTSRRADNGTSTNAASAMGI